MEDKCINILSLDYNNDIHAQNSFKVIQTFQNTEKIAINSIK